MRSKSLTRINKVLFFLVLLFTGFYFASSILIPLLFGVLFAMLMHSVANYFERKGMRKMLSSTLCTLVVFIGVVGLGILMVRQLLLLIEDLPQLREQLTEYYNRIRQFLNDEFGLSYVEQKEFLQERGRELEENAGQIIQTAVGGISSMFIGFLLSLIYMFLMLLNRGKYVGILQQLVKHENREDATIIGEKISKVAQKYLWGRIQVMTILAIMYIITFLVFEVKYAILLTVFGALITIIPYIGPFVSGLLPIIVTIVTGKDLDTVLLFSIIIIIIQLIESYVLEPVLMGSEVNLSPLAIIVIIVVGESIWGVAGMILFVPMLAMAKIYFDHMDNLKIYGKLIESSNPKTHEFIKELVDRIKSRKH